MNLVAPPIKIWLIVISFGIIFVLGFYIYSYSRFGIHYKTAMEIEKLIKTNLSSKKDTLSIIIVGSSLTRFAFGDNFSISKAISQQLEIPVKILKLNIYGLSLQQASDLSIFKTINKYPPDVLFIESRIFFHFISNPSKKIIPFQLNYSFYYLINKFRRKIGLLPMDVYVNLINPKLPTVYYTIKLDQAAQKTILQRDRRVSSFTENKIINKTFDILSKQKKKVILLSFPNSKQVNKVFDKTESQFVKLAQQYQNHYNVAYWSIKSTPFADSLFTDGSHLNYQGSKVYQNWFMKKIKTDL
jgi:hypothetical protein